MRLRPRSCGDASVVESVRCSSRGPGVPSTHMGWLTTSCSTSSRGNLESLPSEGHSPTHLHRGTYLHIIKNDANKIFLKVVGLCVPFCRERQKDLICMKHILFGGRRCHSMDVQYGWVDVCGYQLLRGSVVIIRL